ncbi:10683_t:CDS:2, partial [Entrophospora sp. SA101]
MSYLSDDTTIISLRYLIHSNKELMGQHKGLQKNFTHNSLELLSKTNKSSINATNAPEIQKEDTKVVVTKEKAAEEEEEVMNKLESGIVVVENVSFKASQTRDRAY